MGEILENRAGAVENEATNVCITTTSLQWNRTKSLSNRREYYERTNLLVQQYLYIDRLFDSSLPHDLLNEYNDTPGTSNVSGLRNVEVPPTISEEPRTPSSEPTTPGEAGPSGNGTMTKKVKRTPRELYKVSNEASPLLSHDEDEDEDGPKPEIPGMEDESVESGDRIV